MDISFLDPNSVDSYSWENPTSIHLALKNLKGDIGAKTVIVISTSVGISVFFDSTFDLLKIILVFLGDSRNF